MRTVGRRRWMVWIAGFVLGVLGVDIAILVGSPHVEARARGILEESLLIDHTVERVELRGLTVVAEGLVLHSREGSHFERIAEIPRVEIDLDPLAWASSRRMVREVRASRARFFVEIDDRGDLSLAHVLKPPGQGQNQSADWPRILLDNLEVEFCPKSLFALDEPIAIDRLELRPTEEGLYAFSAHATSQLFEEIRLVASGDHDGRSVTGELDIVDLHVDRAFADRLPESARALWDEIQPRGRADLSFGFRLVDGHLESWTSRLELSDADITLREPHLSVDSISGSIEMESKSHRDPSAIRDVFPEIGVLRTRAPLTGRAFGGRATIDADVRFEEGALESQEIRLSLAAIDAAKLHRLGRRVVPQIARHARAEGRLDADIVIEGGADARSRLDRLDLHDVDLSIDEVPHPIRGLHGGIVWEDGVHRVWLAGRLGDAGLQVTGVGGVFKDEPCRLAVRLNGLRVDDATLGDLPSGIELALRPYNPRGEFDARIDIDREPGARAKVRVGVDVKRGRCLYRGFPIEIDDLYGTVTVYGEIHPEAAQPFFLDRLVLQNLRGKHESCDVRVDLGGYRFARPGEAQGQLDLEVISPNFELTPQLIRAMPPNGADMLRSFSLDGSLSTRVRVHHLTTLDERGFHPVEIAVEARVLEPIVIAHRDLPYPLPLRRGVVDYRSTTDRVYLRELESDPSRGPRIRLDGSLIPDRVNRRLLLSLEAKIDPGFNYAGIEMEDPVFREALPEPARKLLDSLEATGALTGSVRVLYGRRTGQDLADYEPSLEFSGDLRVENGTSRMGVLITDASYAMSVYGQAGLPTQPGFFFTIDVRDSTFSIGNFVIDGARSRVVYGREHPWVRLSRQGRADELPRFDPTFLQRLRPEQVSETLQVVIDDAAIFGGHFEAMAFVDVGARSDFMMQLRAKNIDIAKGSEQLFGSNEAALRGYANGELRVSGITGNPDSMQGEGTAMVRNGRLIEVPVGIVFLRNPLFGIAETLAPDQLAVEEIDAHFRIKGDRILFEDYDDLIIATPAQAFAARGWISFAKRLDLFIAPLGAFYGIPGLSQLIGGAFRIHLTGPVDDPSASMAPYQ